MCGIAKGCFLEFDISLHNYIFGDLLVKNVFFQLLQNRLEGNVEFKKATFHYPTRPQVRVLHDLDLFVTSGQHIFLIDLVDNYLYLFDDLLVKNILF